VAGRSCRPQLDEACARGVEARAARVGERRLACLHPLERGRELALALLHVRDPLGERRLQRRQLRGRVGALSPQRLPLRFEIGVVVAAIEERSHPAQGAGCYSV
jgi:hypothetical protein